MTQCFAGLHSYQRKKQDVSTGEIENLIIDKYSVSRVQEFTDQWPTEAFLASEELIIKIEGSRELPTIIIVNIVKKDMERLKKPTDKVQATRA